MTNQELKQIQAIQAQIEREREAVRVGDGQEEKNILIYPLPRQTHFKNQANLLNEYHNTLNSRSKGSNFNDLTQSGGY